MNRSLENNLCLNVEKRKKLDYFISGAAVEVVHSFKYLGVHISTDLNSTYYIYSRRSYSILDSLNFRLLLGTLLVLSTFDFMCKQANDNDNKP